MLETTSADISVSDVRSLLFLVLFLCDLIWSIEAYDLLIDELLGLIGRAVLLPV